MTNYDHGSIFIVNAWVNAQGNLDWVWNYPGLQGAVIRGLYWDCGRDYDWAVPSSTGPVPTAVFLGSPHRIIDTRVNCAQGVIKAVSEYMDSFHVENFMTYSPAATTTIQIEGPYLGDDLHLKNINGANVVLHLNRGGDIDGAINCNVKFDTCSGITVHSMHGEYSGSQYECYDSDVSFKGGFFFRSDVSPFIMTGNQYSSSMRHVSMEDIMFVDFIKNAPNQYPFNGTGAAGTMMAPMAPDIKMRPGVTLKLKNVSASTYYPSGYGASTLQGVRISDNNDNLAPLSQFNDYAYLLGNECTIVGSFAGPNASYLNQYSVTDGSNVVDCGAGAFPGIAPATDTSTTSSLVAGTYYYNAAIIFDKSRALGIQAAAAEKAIAMTANVGLNYSVGLWRNTTNPRAGILRIYRGTASNSYNYYADVHMSNCDTQIIDDGTMVAGSSWVARTAGPMDALSDVHGIEYSFVNSFNTGATNKNLARIFASALPAGTAFNMGDTVKLPDSATNSQTDYVWNGSTFVVKGNSTLPASVITVPASGVALSAAASKGMYLVSGGVITAIGITRGGVITSTTVSSTGAVIPVNPGDIITLTYTTAPTGINFMPL